MKSSARALAAKIFNRLATIDRNAQDRLRREHTARHSRVDRSSNFGLEAVVRNHRGNPDDISIGPNSSVHCELVTLLQGGQIKIGERSFVGVGSRIWSGCRVTIGNYVLISHNVDIHDTITHSLSWRERRIELEQLLPGLRQVPHRFDIKSRPLVIEDDVWVGFGACVIGGVHIGRGAVIGAHTVVTKDVPAFSVVVGNPMRVVHTLNGIEDEIDA